jgi:transcriptional regulator with XRE-family HTH domain
MMKDQAALNKTLAILAGHIRDRRRALGWTQEKLAEVADMSTNHVARIEVGMRAPSLGTIVRLAKAIDMEVSDILAAEDAKWTDEARELAFSLRSLPESEAEFLLKQFRADIRHSKTLLSEKSRNP